MTICHVTASGQRNTLILPRVAALNHLLQHPEDTIGPCEEPVESVVVVEEEETSMTIIEQSKTGKKKK